MTGMLEITDTDRADYLVRGDLLLTSTRPPSGKAIDAIRIMDLALAAVLLVFLSPIILAVALLIFALDPGPIFFAHRRIGLGGREFPCLKFRTMRVDADACLARLLEQDAAARLEWHRDHKLRNDPRVTAIGRFLRHWSIDELPQLLNVLSGDMSLVGPRPIVRSEVERYGRYYNQYCRVKPGVTGLWQVSGRNDVSYRRRVALDVHYARTQSLALNVWILARTVPCVIGGTGC